jgi:hypothetical protein
MEAWSAVLFHWAWNDPVQRQSLMEYLSLIEREPSVHGASAHLKAVARFKLREGKLGLVREPSRSLRSVPDRNLARLQWPCREDRREGSEARSNM